MTGIIVCLAIIALAEVIGVINQFRATHLADEIGRLESIVLSERKKFEDYQKNVLQEMVSLRKENNFLKERLSNNGVDEYIGTDTERP